ncbi:MAG: GspH/FimT family protein [Rhodoferax sp.]|nr:GspH/FimT family protein [Rhodoferax sp.]
MNPRRNAQAGVTIIELVIVVAVGAVLAAIAIPGLRDTLNSTRQTTALGLLMSDLNQARNEAIKRNVRVLVCASNNAATDCSGSTNWRGGWLVCFEGNVANQCGASAPLAVPPIINPIIARPPLTDSLTLTASAAVIRFNPNSSSTSGTLTLGGTWSGAPNRVATVAVTGFISK